MSSIRELAIQSGLTAEESHRRLDLLKIDPIYQAARNWFITARRVQYANDVCRIMSSRESLVLTSPHPDRVIQQAIIAEKLGRGS